MPDYVQQTSLDELLRHADVVSLHCPLVESTRGLMNAERISMMKHRAILINTSRGPVVDSQALAEALNSGHPSEVLKKGDEVEAIVLEIKKEDQRVSLGIKQLESDPWESINDRFKVGDMVTGQVAKIASFGAFVNLDGDIDGLIHISQLSEDHVERVKDVIKVGDEITARVIKVDSIERRIGLSIKAVNYDT